MKFHIAQFDISGIPDQPAIFTSNEEMLTWLSAQLDTTLDTEPLFPRLNGETPADHAAEFIKIQDEYCYDQNENVGRGGSWNFDDDAVRIWDITFTPTASPISE